MSAAVPVMDTSIPVARRDSTFLSLSPVQHQLFTFAATPAPVESASAASPAASVASRSNSVSSDIRFLRLGHVEDDAQLDSTSARRKSPSAQANAAAVRDVFLRHSTGS
nr:hypothetical protein CFP56_24529 [Quercus suber]